MRQRPRILPGLAGTTDRRALVSEAPDLAQGTEEEKRRVFKRVAGEIYRRLSLFTALPMKSLDRLRLEELTKAIERQ